MDCDVLGALESDLLHGIGRKVVAQAVEMAYKLYAAGYPYEKIVFGVYGDEIRQMKWPGDTYKKGWHDPIWKKPDFTIEFEPHEGYSDLRIYGRDLSRIASIRLPSLAEYTSACQNSFSR